MANMMYATELEYVTNKADIVIRALDVGGGDSILIQTGSQNWLIDTGGNSDSNKQQCEKLLWNALTRYNAKRLHGIIITHPHVDHDGSLPMLLEKVNLGQATIDHVYGNGMVIPLESSRQYKYIHDLDTKYSVLQTGDSKNLGNNTRLDILWPDPSFMAEIQNRTNNHAREYGSINEKEDNNGGGLPGSRDFLEANGAVYSVNNSSIIAKLVRGNFSMLLTGDAGRAVWVNYLGLVASERVAAATQGSSTTNALFVGDHIRFGSKANDDGKYRVYVSDQVPRLSKDSLEARVLKLAHHSQNSANLKSTITKHIKPETVIITGGSHYRPYPANPAMKKWNTFIPRIATMKKISYLDDVDEDDEYDVNDESTTSEAVRVPLKSMYCTGIQGDINIGVFGEEYVVIPDEPDPLWHKKWTEFINESMYYTDTVLAGTDSIRQYFHSTLELRMDSVLSSEVDGKW